MFCPNCACELPAVAKFCVRCGSRIESVIAVQAVPPITTAAPPFEREANLVSKRARFPDAEIAPPFAYAAGPRFVVPRNAVLPSACVKCGNPPSEPWLRKTFYWHHPALYLLAFSPILYVIVAMIVRKKVELVVPLCDAHKSIRRKRLLTGTVLLLTCIPLPIGLATYIGNDEAEALAIWLGVGMFVIGSIFLVCAAPLRATEVKKESAEFKGACSQFLSKLTADSAHASSSPKTSDYAKNST